LVNPYANYCVDILKARWLRPAFAESYRLLRLTQPKELVAVHVKKMTKARLGLMPKISGS